MLEASRLARNNIDWYRLIEICGVSGTLIADEGAVYNPREPNDRLLLGVKGTLSEAELFTLRTRLYEGRWNKARKGMLRFDVSRGGVGRGENLARRVRSVHPHRHLIGVALDRRGSAQRRGRGGFEGRRFAHSGIPFPGER